MGRMSRLRDLALSEWQELHAFHPEWCSSSPLYGMCSLCITCSQPCLSVHLLPPGLA